MRRDIRIDPDDAESYYNRGSVFLDQRDLVAAFSDFDRAVQLNSRFAMAYAMRGSVLSWSGEFNRAIADYTELDPTHAAAFYSRGAVFELQGEMKRAEADFSRARELRLQLQ